MKTCETGVQNDPALQIRSTAAKSPARIGNTSCLEKIQVLATEPSNDLWATMNYFIAMSI
ncbi:MAG: hypothetical protein GY801_07365, partial [bacterium]|nr:hypothetical protein [bacterium]